MPESTEPTPAEIRALAEGASMLAQQLEDVLNRLCGGSDTARRAGFPLDNVAAELRRIRHELGETAFDLARVQAIRDDPRLCQAEWGCAPSTATP